MGSIETTSKLLNGLLNKITGKINSDLNYVNTNINATQRNAILQVKGFKDITDKQNQIVKDQITKKYNESNKVQDVHIQYEQIEVDRIKNHHHY